MSEPTLMHLVRHGQSEWNAAGRIQGQTNSRLSPVGEAQARAAGDALVRRPLDAIYSSDLVRARQTADAIAERSGHRVVEDPRLREMSYGVLEGLTWAEAEAHHPEVYAGLRGGGPDFVVPCGESRQQLLGRTRAVLDGIAAQHPGREVAAVSHGGVLAYFFRWVVGIPLDARPAFRTLNCAISTFERREDGRWRLVTWGAADHLPEEGR